MLKGRTIRGFLICLAVTAAVVLVYAAGALDSLEWRSIDLRFQARGARPANPDIVVVSIDEHSIDRLGRWPWPRETHAKLIDRLSAAGAKAIAFDVLFTEPDSANPKSDAALAASAGKAGNVVSAFFYRGGMDANLLGKDPLFPLPALAKESFVGFVNFNPDPDGVCRHGHLYSIYGNNVYPSLPVAALAMSRKKTFEELLPELPVTVDKDPLVAHNELFINYQPQTDRTGYEIIPFADVVEGKIPDKTFKDKIVLVGGTAAALFDVKATPYTPIFYGVLIHANIIDNLISGNYLKPGSGAFTILYILVVGLILGAVLPRLGPWQKLVVLVAVAGAATGVSFWMFSAKNRIVPLVAPLLATVGCYGAETFYRLLIEEREKRKIKGSFRQYLSPKIIDVITKDPTKLALGGVERDVSIFFLDIAGFTTMAEALKPTQLVEVMNQCLTEFSRIILRHDGLINKYIGDCIMAFWNAPADQPNHAAQACLAALDCIKALPDLNRRFQEKGLPRIDCRVGINTGTVVVGNMGSLERFDYTVMGDPVNLASRLEGANKQYQTRIMISEATFELAREAIEARDLDLIRVKGKREPRKVFEVLCAKGEMSEELSEGRKRFHTALALYRQKRFDEAIDTFQSVFDYLPNDHVTRVYLERARAFTSHPPPPAWDGVYEFATK
ncbi:MAG: adenylate/guanylate cyclase domain-containing protein [Elusimicrobia bacterium]|nr:adenylate/guanylate cyclase domain-containing protein [Elusimicrobiota bacterium]